MDFSLNTEQSLLQETLQRWLGTLADESAPVSGRWQQLMREIGLGLLVPRPGQASMHVEHALVMEALGGALLREPFLEAVVVAGHLLAAVGGEQAEQVLEQLSRADALPLLAWAEPSMGHDFAGVTTRARRMDNGWCLSGHKCMVKMGSDASHFLLLARSAGQPGDMQGLSVFLLPSQTPGLEIRRYPTIDGGNACDLLLNDVMFGPQALLGEEGQIYPVLEQVRDYALAAQCSEARGIVQQLLTQSREYLSARRQFGQALATFQVVQHRLVDMYLHGVKVTAASRLATLSLDDPERRSLAASSAQVVTAAACRFVAQAAVQLHGGMGMSDELQISHYMRRATLIERELGSRDFHLRRYNRLRETGSI